MKIFGVWANLMSLGAIDFGIIVDGAVIIVEGVVLSVHRRLQAGNAELSQTQMDELTYASSRKMMNAAFFGHLIILIVFRLEAKTSELQPLMRISYNDLHLKNKTL